MVGLKQGKQVYLQFFLSLSKGGKRDIYGFFFVLFQVLVISLILSNINVFKVVYIIGIYWFCNCLVVDFRYGYIQQFK